MLQNRMATSRPIKSAARETRAPVHLDHANKNATPALAGMAFLLLLCWWTRRELNPRPKAISGQDYMFSSQFDLAGDTSMSTLAANQPT